MLPRCFAVQAMLGDVLVGRGQSSPVDGEVVLDVDLRQPPGSYTVQFSVVALTMVNTSTTVQVQGCGPGEVTVPGRSQYYRQGPWAWFPDGVLESVLNPEPVAETVVPSHHEEFRGASAN